MASYQDVLTFEYVSGKLRYDPETGKFFWRVDVARNVKAGVEAGGARATRVSKKTGKAVSYRYIRIDGFNITAAPLAWLLGTGKWPKGKLSYSDGDPNNLALSNLEESNYLETEYDHSDREGRKKYLQDHQRAYPLVWKETHLRNKFGISMQEYVELAVKQDGKCAICKKPETQMRGGRIKMLAVDHCHKTGKIRGLLCTECNQAIGKLKDDTAVIESALAYVSKCAGEPEGM